MEEIKELTTFFDAIRDDNRLGTSHISLYMALFQFYNINGFQNPILINRRLVMQAAKISGLATYHKCIRDLSNFHYIHYLPSCNPGTKSQVYLLNLQNCHLTSIKKIDHK